MLSCSSTPRLIPPGGFPCWVTVFGGDSYSAVQGTAFAFRIRCCPALLPLAPASPACNA